MMHAIAPSFSSDSTRPTAQSCGIETALGQTATINSLAARALWPNPFYLPGFLEGSLALKEHRSLSAVLAHAQDGKLIGFLPMRRAMFQESAMIGILKAYRNPYIMRSEPMIDRDAAEAACLALINELAANRSGDRLFLFPMLDMDGPVFKNLTMAAAMLNRSVLVLESHERPALFPGDSLHSDRMKDAKRRLRRLKELGQVDIRLNIAGRAAEGMLDAFLKLEASGWKGRAGTALASDPATEAFARQAFGVGNHEVTFDALVLEGKPVAMNLNLNSFGQVMTLKSGYDEAFRATNPGIVLDCLLSEAVVQGAYGRCIDSCATPGHNLEKLWPSRLRIGSLLIDIAPKPAPRSFAVRAAFVSQIMQIRQRAKGVVRQVMKQAS